MTQFNWKKLIPHFVALVVFVLVAVVYCQPTLDGKVVSGGDLTQWKAEVQQMQVYKDTHGHFPLWSNSMFGGMPGFLIASDGTNPIPMNYFLPVSSLFLPTPMSFFFLMCVSFYFLALVLRVNPWVGIMGALAYAYASFSAILVIAGHETEIWAMGYVPFLLGALILIFEGKYWWGTALTALSTYLLVSINHIQIVYYLGIMVAFMGIAYLIQWIKAKQYKQLALAIVLAGVGGGLGIMANAGMLLTNYDYSKATLRNGALSLDTASGKMVKSKGLDVDYAFTWSYGLSETFTLVTPNIYGGSSILLPQDGKLADALGAATQLPEQAKQQLFYDFPAYWGAQERGTSGPVYLGAVMCFLLIFSLFYLRSKHKWWLVSVTALAVVMAWGKSFGAFNDFLFYHLPLYDKFRSPTMSLVIPQLTFPILVVLGLQQLFYGAEDRAFAFQQFKKAALCSGILMVILMGLYFTFTYRTGTDLQWEQRLTQAAKGDPSLGRSIVGGAAADRQDLFGADLLRTFVFIVLAAGVLFLYVKGKVKAGIALGALGILSFVDLITVDTRYLSFDKFKDPDENAAVFNPTPADQEIGRDTSYYRMINFTVDTYEDAIPSYFHNNVGGYHAAKLALFQDLLVHQLGKQPTNMAVFDMLNTKYFIVANPQTNQPQVEINRGALGPCWLVQTIQYVDGPAAAMKALDNFNPRDTAVVEEEFKSSIPFTPKHDSAGYVRLIHNDNDVIRYESSSTGDEFAVFSEIYYDRGWKAYIDDKEAPIVKTDYLLRGLALPAGRHQIRFEFRPKAYYSGRELSAIASILIILLLAGAVVTGYRSSEGKIQKV